MEKYTGNHLLKNLNDFDVDLGKLNQNVICGWFDTDSWEKQSLLAWLCSSFDKNNYLHALECEEYEHIINNDLWVEEDNFAKEFSVFDKKYTDILHVEEAEFDVEVFTDEIQLCLDKEREQQNLIKSFQNIRSNFNKNINEVSRDESDKKLEKLKNYEKCLSLCKSVDDACKKLQDVILRYKQNLDDIEYAPTPLFFSVMDTEIYNQRYKEIMNYELILKEQVHDDESDFNICNTIKDETCIFDGTDELETIHKRILSSKKYHLMERITGIQLEEGINYLKLNIDSLKFNAQCMSKLEVNKKRRHEQIDRILKKIMNSLARIVSFQVYQAKTEALKFAITSRDESVKILQTLHKNINKILHYEILIEMCYNIEMDTIKCSCSFLRNVQHYINKDLNSCEMRIDEVNKSVEKHKMFKNIPIEKQYSLLGCIKKIFSHNSEAITIQTIFDVINKFKAEKERIEYEVIQNCANSFHSVCKPMENNINVLKQYLKNGPSNKLLLFPYELANIFLEIESHLKAQKEGIRLAVQMLAKTKKSITSDQLTCLHRLLWMYFIREPKKMLYYIEDVKHRTKEVL